MSNASNIVLLSGQLALSQAMDVVANNIANASTTGFKREGIAFDTILKQSAANANDTTNFVYDRATYRDVSNGPITPTGNNLDLAIQGEGYFSVKLPNGNTAYTRAGTFQLNTEGQLVTQSGLPVTGDGGTISVPNTATAINISADGYVTAKVDNGAALAQLGKIGLVKFQNEQNMQPLGAGLYSSSETPQPAIESSIKQGSIEESNVQPVTEITNMIRIMRSYEQATNLITKDNDRATDAITRLVKSQG